MTSDSDSDSSPTWDQAGELLGEILDAAPTERRRRLEELCNSDTDLKDRLLRLLDAHEDAEGFLEALDTETAASLVANVTDQLPADFRQYSFVREIGRGAMGVVYLARDSSLDRDVALKLLPDRLCQDPVARERFIREARAVSVIDDPHIATVYEIDELPDESGRLYISMQYYPGETLRARIARGPLDERTALDYVRQVALGLRAAHEHNLVHRDVKPGNILITERGTAKLLDFGIAKGPGTDLTRTDTAVGTIAYMSPEQTGVGRVDARTDIWSLGAVLYEMLSGRKPFDADADPAVIFAIRNDSPAVITGCTPTLWGVISKCLAKNPDDRYATAVDLCRELETLIEHRSRRVSIPRRIAATAAVLAVVMVTWIMIQSRNSGSDARKPAAAPVTRIAVMPLENLSPDPGDEFLADGITQELNRRLSLAPGLGVVARSSISRLGPRSTVQEIAAALDVSLILEGSLSKHESDIRVALSLVDAAKAEQVWSHDFEGSYEKVISLEAEVAGRAMDAIEGRGAVALSSTVSGATDSSPAYTSYLKGRYLLANASEENLRQAVTRFNEAIEHDPSYALAWSGLADAYTLLGGWAVIPADEAHSLARAAAERALELDADLAEAHTSLAAPYADYYWDFGKAEHHFRRAIDLNPNSADALQWYAEMLAHLGRHSEALDLARRALKLDPLSPRRLDVVAELLHYARRHDEAIETVERLMQTYPDFEFGRFRAAILYLAVDRSVKTIALLDNLSDAWGESPNLLSLQALAIAREGRTTEARAILRRFETDPAFNRVSDFHRAPGYIGIGQYDRAIDALESAYEDRIWLMTIINVEPVFDPLRGHPRFEALVDSVGLRRMVTQNQNI